MMKIKNKAHLTCQKQQIKNRQLELEHEIYNHWQTLKESIQPQKIFQNQVANLLNSKSEESFEQSSILKSSINFGLVLLAQKLSNEIGILIKKVFTK